MKKLKFTGKDGELEDDSLGIFSYILLIIMIIIILVVMSIVFKSLIPLFLIIIIAAPIYYLWSKEYIKWE